MALSSLVLAAIAILSTAEARAGCDHSWVKRLAGPSSLTDLKILAHATGPDASRRESPGQPGPSPCARGACSPAPVIPVSPSEQAPRRAETWGLLECAVQPSPAAGRGYLPEHESSSPRHRTIPVERPPR
jgi:hypothetical protein